jgi:predicted dehydrogenase
MSPATHTLAFLDPGHFHAALTLRERHPRVSEEIFVYAPPGPELDDFLALIDAFNRRGERPTAWRSVIRAGSGSLERLEAERPGDVVVLAGRNDRKMRLMRRCHDAGFHVLADKPWLAGWEGLDDLRHTLAAGPLAVEIMTGRHDVTSLLTRRLVAEAEVFGDFTASSPGAPAVEMASVHHLEKMVNAAPLRRPAWFFDVRVQGDGIADIPTHMVDAAQRLVAASASRAAVPSGRALELIAARRWASSVPRSVFSRITGLPDFPPEIQPSVEDGTLAYAGNAELSFRAGDVAVALDTRWDLTEPAGGGDTSRTVIRGTRAEIRIEQSASTGFRRRLSVVPRLPGDGRRSALERTVASWQAEYPGVTLAAADAGWEIRLPRALDAGHESHFPLVLADFLALIDQGGPRTALAADTLAKYTLLVDASRAAHGSARASGTAATGA